MKHLALLFLLAASAPAAADPPVIENATGQRNGNLWRFDVTLSHPDTGWEHYADGWRVLDIEGNELGTRVLAHPHEAEQPFTRALTGIALPDGTTRVQIQPRCNVDGWNDKTRILALP